MLTETQQAGLDRYLQVLEILTPDSLKALKECWTPGVRFVDPFNDVRGSDAAYEIFFDLFERTQSVTFKVDRRYVNETGAIVHWVMTAHTKPGIVLPKVWTIDGVSEIDVAADGRIQRHIDFWDAGQQFYAYLPLIGPIIRFIQRKVSHG